MSFHLSFFFSGPSLYGPTEIFLIKSKNPIFPESQLWVLSISMTPTLYTVQESRAHSRYEQIFWGSSAKICVCGGGVGLCGIGLYLYGIRIYCMYRGFRLIICCKKLDSMIIGYIDRAKLADFFFPTQYTCLYQKEDPLYFF